MPLQGMTFYVSIELTLRKKVVFFMSGSRRHTAAVLTACVAFVIFGFSFMFSSIALSITAPMVLLCCRFVAAVVTLSLVVGLNALVGRIRGRAWFSFSLKGKPLGGLILL